MTPNPSLHPTRYSGLRPPPRAGELKLQGLPPFVKRRATVTNCEGESSVEIGLLEKWGLGYEELAALNPKLIMVRISGYGQTGPYRERPGFAAIAECMGGLRHVTGFQDRPPVRVGVSLGDTLASLYGTIGALMAMHHLKVNGGKGQYIDVALYEAVFARDGKSCARICSVRPCARAIGGEPAGHLAVEHLSLQRWQVRRHRRQRRRDLQALDDRDWPRGLGQRPRTGPE